MSYTEQTTQLIIEEYSADPCRETVDRLAEEHGKTARSIIAKLASAGVYQAPPRLSKNGEPVTRKEDLAKEIGDWFGIEVASLSKAAKLDLQKLHKALSNPDFVRAHLVDLEEC
jgi:ATP-dependent Clp protease ATP-binding subunit ClpA